MEVIVKNIINIFTIIDGKINILVNKNDLIDIDCFDEFNKINNEYLNKNINCSQLNLKQTYTFSKKEEDKLFITVLFNDIVNINDIDIVNNDLKFVPLNNIDINIYIEKSIEYLRKELVLNSVIKKLYPDEFILPEIQKIYEELLNKKYDRRNFRKRLIKLDVIEDLNKMSNNKLGRPAKLYKFKDIIEDKILF